MCACVHMCDMMWQLRSAIENLLLWTLFKRQWQHCLGGKAKSVIGAHEHVGHACMRPMCVCIGSHKHMEHICMRSPSSCIKEHKHVEDI